LCWCVVAGVVRENIIARGIVAQEERRVSFGCTKFVQMVAKNILADVKRPAHNQRQSIEKPSNKLARHLLQMFTIS
jgi:hypothetical protein